jgi:hypothetical protein
MSDRDAANVPARTMLRRWIVEDQDLFARLAQLRDEMRHEITRISREFDQHGVPSVTASRWADTLDAILSGDQGC